jgi:hypothetical protein
MTNEPILLPVAPHSVDSEFRSAIDKYRGLVKDAVFDRLGRRSFFDEVVEVVMGRLKARVEKQGSAEQIEGRQPTATANSKSPSCAFAPQLILELAQSEARKLRSEIERRFMRTGKFELPAAAQLTNS